MKHSNLSKVVGASVLGLSLATLPFTATYSEQCTESNAPTVSTTLSKES